MIQYLESQEALYFTRQLIFMFWQLFNVSWKSVPTPSSHPRGWEPMAAMSSLVPFSPAPVLHHPSLCPEPSPAVPVPGIPFPLALWPPQPCLSGCTVSPQSSRRSPPGPPPPPPQCYPVLWLITHSPKCAFLTASDFSESRYSVSTAWDSDSGNVSLAFLLTVEALTYPEVLF